MTRLMPIKVLRSVMTMGQGQGSWHEGALNRTKSCAIVVLLLVLLRGKTTMGCVRCSKGANAPLLLFWKCLAVFARLPRITRDPQQILRGPFSIQVHLELLSFFTIRLWRFSHTEHTTSNQTCSVQT